MHFSDPTDFDEAAHPELSDIFRGIDIGIAAIIASDPTLRRKSPARRKHAAVASKAPSKRPVGKSRRSAA